MNSKSPPDIKELVSVDRSLCFGSELCVRDFGAIFSMGVDDFPEVQLNEGAEVALDELKAAMQNCPAGAIVVSDGERQLPGAKAE